MILTLSDPGLLTTKKIRIWSLLQCDLYMGYLLPGELIVCKHKFNGFVWYSRGHGFPEKIFKNEKIKVIL